MIDMTGIIANQETGSNLGLINSSTDLAGNSEAMEILFAERGEGFYNYLDWLGLAKDPNLVVLSSLHHYFYSAEELNNANTFINLKELNQIKRIKSHFNSCLPFLPQKSNFIGCFIDNKKINGYVLKSSSPSDDKVRNFNDIDNDIVSRIPFINMLYSIMDLKTNTYMSENRVSLLLEDYGFEVMDMTELNGLTFFHSQKYRATYN
jgi:hypothetical protein